MYIYIYKVNRKKLQAMALVRVHISNLTIVIEFNFPSLNPTMS